MKKKILILFFAALASTPCPSIAFDWQDAALRFAVPCAFGLALGGSMQANKSVKDMMCIGLIIGVNADPTVQGAQQPAINTPNPAKVKYDLEKMLKEAEERPILPSY